LRLSIFFNYLILLMFHRFNSLESIPAHHF